MALGRVSFIQNTLYDEHFKLQTLQLCVKPVDSKNKTKTKI